MRSSQLDLGIYDSDKITNRYLEWYDPVLEPFLKKEVALLELGIFKGGSLLLWRDYFPFGTIVGVDIKLPKDFQQTNRIHVFKGSQADLKFLSGVANEIAPDGFDIIIDDASHIGELTKTGFWHLFDNHLKPEGLYIIEDWGTGYWDDWPDGRSLDLNMYTQKAVGSGVKHIPLFLKIASRLLRFKIAKQLLPKSSWPCHSYGMVGFIKQLIDEQAAADVTSKSRDGKPERASKFENILITPSIVFIKKAKHLS